MKRSRSCQRTGSVIVLFGLQSAGASGIVTCDGLVCPYGLQIEYVLDRV